MKPVCLRWCLSQKTVEYDHLQPENLDYVCTSHAVATLHRAIKATAMTFTSLSASAQPVVWSVMLWRQITLHLCWKIYTGYESREGSSTSYVSLHSTVNIVWHHPTCPTNFNKSLEWNSIWDHWVRQRSSYQLLEGRHWVTRAFLVAAARTWNSLPSTVTAASTLHSFRRALKTHLFTESFPPS